jgi:hypothetical protein
MKLGRKPVLLHSLHEELEEQCLHMRHFFALAMNNVRCLAYQLAQTNNYKTHFLKPVRRMEKNWLYVRCQNEFPKVYPILKLQVSLQKQSFSFSEQALEKINDSPPRQFNCNEARITGSTQALTDFWP